MRSAIGALIAVSAGGILAFLYTRTHPDPPGVTGYYYLKQIEVLAGGGGFFFRDHSLAFLLPAALSRALGDPLDACRLAISLTWAALVVGVALLSARLAAPPGAPDRSSARIRLGLLGAGLALALTSVTLHELALNFYKNLFGLTLITWALVILHGPRGASRPGQGVAATLAILALLSHKSMFLLVALYMGSRLLRVRSRRNLKLLLAGGAALLALFLLIFARSQHYLLAVLSFFDTPGGWFLWIRHVVQGDRALAGVIGCGLLALILYVARRSALPPERRVLFDAAAALLVLCLHPFQRAGTQELAYRIILITPAFTIPLVLTVAARTRLVSPAAGLALLMAAQALAIPGRPRDHFPPWSALDGPVMAIKRHVTPKDYLISQHGMESYIGYRTGIRSKHYLPDEAHARVFRVAYVPAGRPGGEARDELNMARLAQIGPDHMLLREQDWQQISRQYRLRPHWKNPDTHRPAHIHQ